MFYMETLGDIFERTSKTVAAVVFGCDLIWISCFLSVLQSPARAILGDVIPQSQQLTANTIASVMMSLGASLTNLFGGLKLIPQDGHEHLITNEQLSIIVSAALVIIGVLFTLVAAREEPLFEELPKRNPFRDVIEAAFTLPRPILRVAVVYFFSWMSYFPFQITVTDFFGTDIFHGSSDFDTGDRQKYDAGVTFGMFVVASVNFVVLIYTAFQPIFSRPTGMRLWYGVSQLIGAASLLSVLVTDNRYWLLALLSLVGVSLATFNSVPFAIVGLIKPGQMGVYMGVLNCFAVFAQEISLSLVCAGIGSLFGGRAPILAVGALFAVIAAILCIGIVVPQTEESHVMNLIHHDPFKSALMQQHGS
jgi:solute carrier family 45 protein 1/2/4